MARRRRLNKKVALIGTMVLLLLAAGAVLVILKLSRDPAQLIADGDAAWAAQDYKTAADSYRRAYGLLPSAPEKIDLLFKLADVYKQTDQWDRVLGCWNAIVTSDPPNVKARLGQLKYCYILADGLSHAGQSTSGYWEEVLSQARKAMDAVEKAGLLTEDRTAWEPAFGTAESRGWSRGSARLGPHLRFVKGRAAFELAALGAATAPAELLQEAQSDLQEAKKLDPNNVQVYRYLAEVLVTKAEAAAVRGSVDQQNVARQQADEILAEAVLAAGDVPEAHLNVLTRQLMLLQRGGITAAREQMRVLEPQYASLAQRFASDPQVLAALGQFYAFYAAYLDSAGGREKLELAIQAAEQARALDRGNVEYALLTAGYHYRKFSLYGDEAAVSQAVALTEQALGTPGAQNRSGPTQFTHRVNRLALYALLGKCGVERLMTLAPSDPAREGLLTRVEKAVHEIRQIRGAGADPEVIKWQGMLDLARGQTGKAVRSLYSAYEQIKAAHPPERRDPFLAWTLAQLFERTAETGAVIDFLSAALSAGIVYTRPDALLDYGAALLRVGLYDTVLSVTGVFQERFGDNDRSRLLRIKALIAKGQATEAEREIAQLKPGEPNTIALHLDLTRSRSSQLLTTIRRQELSGPEGNAGTARVLTEELRGHHTREAELVQQMLRVNPEGVEESQLAELCESLLAQGDTSTAQAVAGAFPAHAAENVTASFYRSLLSEPDPRNCPPARRRELREQAARALGDPVRRCLQLGLFYEQTQQPDKAIPALRSVLIATARSEDVRNARAPAYTAVRPSSPRQMAAGYLFDLARRQENWALAEEMAELAKREDLDECGGRLFAARLAFARKEYDVALNHLNECLTQRPVFSHGYLLRSEVKAALGKEEESIADARKASNLNPADPLVAKGLAQALHARHRRLGPGLSSEQRQETRQALEQALRVDPRDPGLLNAYIDFLRDNEPEKVVALRQTIQASAPTVDNAVMLGKLAAQVALGARDPAKRDAFFTVADTAFEQARKLDPTGLAILETYADYLRARGQNDKAVQLLAESKEPRLLWRHHFRTGSYAEARRLLEAMYRDSAGRSEALKGLVLVAEAMSDRAGAKTYSDELVTLEDNAANRIMQLQTYLNMGLVAEAEQRLPGLKEKYPGEPRAMLMEALVAAGRHRWAEATDGIDKCIRSAGPETDAGREYTARKAQLLTTAYNATSDKTHLRKAIAVYESLRVKWPKNSSVLNNLAYLLAQNNERLAEALEYARTAVEQEPQEPSYWDTYGYLLYRNGKHTQAAQSLVAALQKYEVRGMASTDAYEHLGLVQEALGDRAQARDAYRRALEVGGSAMPDAARRRIEAALGRLAE